MPITVAIERARSEDAEAIFEVQRQTWIDIYPNADAGITEEDIVLRIEGENGERVAKKIDKWRKAIETKDGTRAVFIARVDRDVVGFVAPCFIDDRRRIGALYVLPTFQGNGIGNKLMKRALEWHGPTEDIYIAVATYDHNAINFYKRFGFEQTDRPIRDEGDVYRGKEIPEVEMVRRSLIDKLF